MDSSGDLNMIYFLKEYLAQSVVIWTMVLVVASVAPANPKILQGINNESGIIRYRNLF